LEKNAEIIFPEWDFLLNYLEKNNVCNRSLATLIILHLISVDNQNKFKGIFEEFFELLNDRSLIISRKI
jgi:hypothetical protein